MAALKGIIAGFQSLNAEWSKKPPNVQKCIKQMEQLKVMLTALQYLPSEEKAASKEELIIARDILEVGAQLSVAAKDIPAFQRYMSQLKTYYNDYKNELPESVYKFQLLGLNLLCLLSQNRVAEFHMELELIPLSDIQTNIYIKHPVAMEQYLMEGCYNKIFLAKGNVPAESYNFFIDILLNTIRDEIARCLEKSYQKLSFSEAGRLLYFQNQAQMKDYGEKKNWAMLQDGYYYFTTEAANKDEQIPSLDLALRAIEYAKDLEMIV